MFVGTIPLPRTAGPSEAPVAGSCRPRGRHRPSFRSPGSSRGRVAATDPPVSNPSRRGGWTRDGIGLCADAAPAPYLATMSADHTTAAVERYLIALAGDGPADPVIRDLLDRAVGRLRVLCAGLLY